ncbi:MAG: cation:proton antiporter subunit C [Candidatus Margulisiibacteriota bacterium]|nr:cation:proton antiporter subunit C [Candidatus Margulisiibacteriota bacterium]
MMHLNYIAAIILMMLGLWAMLAKKNIIKKLIGMAIFQTGIILFYISIGAKAGSTIPILEYHSRYDSVVVSEYSNPLTQILMLTAIVVGVATLGLGLTLARKVYENYESFNEDEILEKVRQEND